MDVRPLSEDELARLSEKAERLQIAMRKRNPTQGAWDSLRWLEEALRQKQIQRNRILAIDRVLKSFDIQ